MNILNFDRGLASIRAKAYLIIGLLLFCKMVQSQHVISGTVVDEENFPLIGVNVIETGTTNGVITDIDGSYEITMLKDTTQLEFTYVGHDKLLLAVNSSISDLVIVMESDDRLIGCGVIITAPEIEFSQNVSRLNRKDLVLNPAANISEALNFTPGVVMQSGTYGTNRLTMRGIGSRNQFGTAKILGYWNGIPLTNTRGELAIDDLNLDFANEVDVMRGPSAPNFGSSLGGVIDFKTTAPRYSGIESRVSVGSFGLLNTSTIANISAMSNRLKGKVGVATLASDGWRQNNAYDRTNINGHLTYTAGKRSNIIVSAFFMDVDALGEIPSSINIEDFESDRTLAAANWLAVRGNEDYESSRLGLSVQYGTLSNWLFKAAYSRYQFENDELRPFNRLIEFRESDAYRFTTSKEELFGSDLRLEAGVEIISEDRDWVTTRDSMILDDFVDDGLNVMEFINLRYLIDGGYEVQLGASAAQHRYELTDLTDTITDGVGTHSYSNFSPSLKIKRSSNFNQIQYLSISHGFSPPNSDEILASDNKVNTEILPETGWTFEVGARDYRNRWQYDITAFFMPTANLLVPQRISEEVTIGVNAGETRHLGLELVGRYVRAMTGDVEHNFAGMLSISHNRFVDFELDDVQFAGNDVTGIAPLTAALRWEGIYKGFDTRVDYQYRSSQPIDDGNTIFSDPYALLNASIGYQRSFLDSDALNIFARVNINNIIDQNYSPLVLVNASSFGGSLPRYFYPGIPRNVVATLGVKYDLVQ